MKLTDRINCVGCFACEAICPQGCISRERSKDGFLYPVIDEKKCLNCDACYRICPVNVKEYVPCEERSLAVYCQDEQYSYKCSSSGLFKVIGETILEQGGVVCAAAFTEEYSVEHIIVREQNQLGKVLSSKYTQSYIPLHIFHELRKEVKDRKVLFCGTPCQTHAIKKVIGNSDNLITIDLVCHGVPSPAVWEKYLHAVSQGKTVSAVNFRDKGGTDTERQKQGYGLRISCEDGSIYYKSSTEDPYLQGFICNLYLRNSCYSCPFKGKNRVSDLTLGDLWGSEKIDSRLQGKNYVSWVIIHSQISGMLAEKDKNRFLFYPIRTEDAVHYNLSYVNSANQNTNRASFFEQLVHTNDIISLIDKFSRVTYFDRMKQKLRRLLSNNKVNGRKV